MSVLRPLDVGLAGSAISAIGVGKSYGAVAALSDVTLDILPSAITGIVGPNGSGKSTFLACIVGLQATGQGLLFVGDHVAGTDEAKDLLSFTPDDLPMPDLLTGYEYLRLVCDLERRRAELGIALDLADVFGIASDLRKLIGGYSHGMRRRLQFSAALSSHAEVLIMDEPYSGLDAEGTYLLRSALQDLSGAGRTVVVTMHDLHLAERECDRVVVLSRGRCVAAGDPRELVAAAGSRSLEQLVLQLSGTLDGVEHNAARLRSLMRQAGGRRVFAG